jgi:hypothetical protein
MGISANQFWATSVNGKAMMVMLAQRNDVELCKDTCEWLVDQRELALRNELLAGGTLSPESCKLKAREAVASMRATAEGINDRNVQACVESVVDNLFHRFYVQGPKVYGGAMAQLANLLRVKIVDDK